MRIKHIHFQCRMHFECALEHAEYGSLTSATVFILFYHCRSSGQVAILTNIPPIANATNERQIKMNEEMKMMSNTDDS